MDIARGTWSDEVRARLDFPIERAAQDRPERGVRGIDPRGRGTRNALMEVVARRVGIICVYRGESSLSRAVWLRPTVLRSCHRYPGRVRLLGSGCARADHGITPGTLRAQLAATLDASPSSESTM